MKDFQEVTQDLHLQDHPFFGKNKIDTIRILVNEQGKRLETFDEMASEALQLPNTFIGWIESCFNEARYSISFNGSLIGFFKGARGIRQGDPLSPILFVIAINVLSCLLNLVATKGLFGYHPKCKKLGLTYLYFVDDLLIFCKGNIESVYGVISVLDQLYEMSGLKLNYAKCELYIVGITFRNLEHILQSTGFKQGCFLVRYLGVPLVTRKLIEKDCVVLIEKIKSKLHHWIEQLCSRFFWKDTDKVASGAREHSCGRGIIVGSLDQKLRYQRCKLSISGRYSKFKLVYQALTQSKSSCNLCFIHMSNDDKRFLERNTDRLPTRERLLRLGILIDGSCIICKEAMETTDHLFSECSLAVSLWKAILNLSGLSTPSLPWVSMLDWASGAWKALVRKYDRRIDDRVWSIHGAMGQSQRDEAENLVPVVTVDVDSHETT
ncbi:uncharacterized protein LOC120158749 [Hibiscus syriacus]|uniref:uncharacterized protein LOC120158749 n=1 Tax=Hibiscus syriacus TaxID=106335 RepID=UPI0019231295|nr:uncharacterized protein LOC120158749 [Hibiscus syriacus]